jgi:serine/threonine-protein kinase
MLYELTCGRSPFYRPETEGVIYAIRVEEPPPPHTLRAGYPLSLSRIIQKCLVKDRERRYQTADEIRLALEDALLVDMPTTQVDVINYIAGLFGNEVERTGVYVPPNVPVHELKKRGAPTLAEHNQNEDDDDERTAAMPAPVGYQPPQATLQDGDHDPDDEPTARTGVDRPLASAPEPTYPMNERPGPPVPNDVQDVSYQSVPFSSAPVSTERSERQQSASSPSVQVDLEALLTTPVFSKNAKTSEPSVPTELQIPAYPPSAGPLVRPGPPVDPESLSSATRTEAALGTRPEPPARQPPPQPRMVGPGPTNLNPLDPLETGEPKALKPKRSKRIVKRRVAGDPEDHLATVDFRDAEASPSANTWFIAATIVLAAFAVVMIAWLVWPAAPLQLPDSPPGPPQAEPLPVVKSPQSKPLPGLVNVQFRAAKTTKLFVDGAAINPGEIRAVPPGPLTVAYRCPPTKRDQRPRELTLATKVTEGAAQPFIIEVSCR